MRLTSSGHLIDRYIRTCTWQALLLHTGQSVEFFRHSSYIWANYVIVHIFSSNPDPEAITSLTYRLSVTKVPVNFLHRRNADSNRSGSSLRNFSSRTTFSISLERTFRREFCSIGNRIFNSATVLLIRTEKSKRIRTDVVSTSDRYRSWVCLPSSAKYQCHIFNGCHIDACTTIYHLAT